MNVSRAGCTSPVLHVCTESAVDVEVVAGEAGVADGFGTGESVRDGVSLESGGLGASLEAHAVHIDALGGLRDARRGSAGSERDGGIGARFEHRDHVDGVGELVGVQDPAALAGHRGGVGLREVEQVDLVFCDHWLPACLVPRDVVLGELQIRLVREGRDA